MKELFEKLYEKLTSGLDTVLVSVTASHGSVPRGAGARMLVSDEGFFGTIGGGLVEFEAQKLAKELLRSRQSHFKNYTLDAEKVAGLGMVCGGNVSVCFLFVPGHDERMKTLIENALSLLDGDEDAWLLTELTGGELRTLALFSERTGLVGMEPIDTTGFFIERAQMLQRGDRIFYAEPLCRRGRCYIFGGGHVAKELVPVLSHVGFRCTVIDDRQEFANAERFPTAEATMAVELEEAFASLVITERDDIVIMTRGHMRDYETTVAALKTPARYIGVIGSRKKHEIARERMAKEGFSAAEIARITGPIGLSIGAETPEEIAISIAAQMIAVRSGGKHHA